MRQEPSSSESPLRAGIDASAAAVERPTGVAVAIRAQVEALGRLEGRVELTVLYRLSRLTRWRTFARGPHVRVFHDRVAPLLSRRLDVFHGPDARLPRFDGPRLIATVHDLSARRDPRFARASFRATREAHWADVARRASAVVTYTRAVRDEVVSALGLARERVAVVPLGVAPRPAVDEQAERALRARLALDGSWALFLGELSARKNLAGAARALALASERSAAARDLALVVVGRPGHGADDELAAARAALGERVRLAGYLPAPEARAALAGARLLLFPSRYEGFGLPILEAFAASVPVVASRDASAVEVAGGAALHAEADDAAGLAEQVVALLEDAALRDGLVARGLERARAFTWERTGEGLARVYEAVRLGAPLPELEAEREPCRG